MIFKTWLNDKITTQMHLILMVYINNYKIKLCNYNRNYLIKLQQKKNQFPCKIFTNNKIFKIQLNSKFLKIFFNL